MRLSIPSVLALLAVTACSTDEVDPPAADVEVVLHTTEVTLAPGEERYLCWSVPMPADGSFPLAGIDFDLPAGIHHYQLQAQSAPNETQPWDCGFGEGSGPPPDGEGGPPPGAFPTMLAVGGPGTPTSVRFPEGTAAMLAPGMHVVIQLHVLNPATAPRTFAPAAAHLLRSTGAAEDLEPVGILLVNDATVSLPPSSSDIPAGVDCAVPAPLESVFAVWPHMHLLGTHIEVTAGDETVVDQPWDFERQQIYPTTTSVPSGGSIRVRCTYDNPTSEQVEFGMSTHDEMCTAFVYYHPAIEGFSMCENGD